MITRVTPILLAGCLLVSACGGGDDDDGSADTATADSGSTADTTPSTTAATASTTTSVATTSTVPPVVEGATVVVANSSIVGGAAGRMTDELVVVGYTTATPTNGVEKLDDSIVYYTDDDGAEDVAESLGLTMGGVEVAVMPDPIPTETGELDGAQVLLLLGNNEADRTLEQLAGSEEIANSGSTVVVANTSGISGAAGRMTATLEDAGFTVGEATNGVDQRAESIVYYTDTEGAEEDAEILGEALGGVDVEPVPDEIPTESGDLDADILVLLGTNQADKSLEVPST